MNRDSSPTNGRADEPADNQMLDAEFVRMTLGYRGDAWSEDWRPRPGHTWSDGHVEADVRSQLEHADFDASKVAVRVERGIVYLSGLVDDLPTLEMVNDLAVRCCGVGQVVSDVRVRLDE
jgi:hypothetical protein